MIAYFCIVFQNQTMIEIIFFIYSIEKLRKIYTYICIISQHRIRRTFIILIIIYIYHIDLIIIIEKKGEQLMHKIKYLYHV